MFFPSGFHTTGAGAKSMKRPGAGVGCSGCGGGCIITLIVNLLLGSFAVKYCLMHWLPALHNTYPTTFGLLDPNTSIFSLKLIVLGLLGGELFIPGAIVTWLLVALSIIH